MKLKEGDQAPNFTLPDASGQPVRLYDLVGQKIIVLYFYPKDMTPGCTKEACGFRDNYPEFQRAGAEVIGVSGQGQASHQQFIQMHGLPFILLSDEKNEVRELYGAITTMANWPARITYVIDKQGVIRYVFDSMTQAEKHVSEALRIIKEINQH